MLLRTPAAAFICDAIAHALFAFAYLQTAEVVLLRVLSTRRGVLAERTIKLFRLLAWSWAGTWLARHAPRPRRSPAPPPPSLLPLSSSLHLSPPSSLF